MVILYTIPVSTFTSLAPVAKVQGTLTHAIPGWQRPTAYTVVSRVSAHGHLNITGDFGPHGRTITYAGYKFHMFVWKLQQ